MFVEFLFLCFVLSCDQTHPKVSYGKQLREDARKHLSEPEELDADMKREQEIADECLKDDATIAASYVCQTFDREKLVLDDVSLGVGPARCYMTSVCKLQTPFDVVF